MEVAALDPGHLEAARPLVPKLNGGGTSGTAGKPKPARSTEDGSGAQAPTAQEGSASQVSGSPEPARSGTDGGGAQAPSGSPEPTRSGGDGGGAKAPSAQDPPAPGGGGALGLPASMKVLGDDGHVQIVTFGVNAAEGVSHCCGLPPPPGGWFGPFGFFRIASFALAAVAVFALVLALLSCFFRDCLSFFSSLLLAFAAVCCAVTAYSHEGLANEVTEMARQNDRFAQKNEQLAKQTEQLGDVAKRLDSYQQSLGMHLDELQEALHALRSITATSQLATVLRAFTDADSNGTADQRLLGPEAEESLGTTDQRLLGPEVDEFFDNCRDLLKEAAPDFHFDRLQAEAATDGIGLDKMRFLVNAIVAGSDAQPGRSTAMLCLVLFSADPKQHFEECQEALRVVLKRSSQEELKALLQDKIDKNTAASGSLPCKDLQDIAKRVMLSSTS